MCYELFDDWSENGEIRLITKLPNIPQPHAWPMVPFSE